MSFPAQSREAFDCSGVVPVAGLIFPSGAARGGPTGGPARHRPRRAAVPGVRASGIAGIIRRQPVESDTPGEFIDPDAPGSSSCPPTDPTST
jgi:hypothetical protein